jgi:hypothetical protein
VLKIPIKTLITIRLCDGCRLRDHHQVFKHKSIQMRFKNKINIHKHLNLKFKKKVMLVALTLHELSFLLIIDKNLKNQNNNLEIHNKSTLSYNRLKTTKKTIKCYFSSSMIKIKEQNDRKKLFLFKFCLFN